MTSTSPPSKRVKLESVSPVTTPKLNAEEETEEGGCSICLQEISDQTILPTCSHEFCFECLLIWTKQSRRCPLCSREIGEYLIHNIRSKHDFSKHYLTPLRSSPLPQNPLISVANLNLRRVSSRRRPAARERERERRQREELNEVDKLQQSIGKRRWVYRNGLYAKHVASNAFTRYKPYPSPAQFSMSPDLISRTTSFVRRELQIWPNLDIEFLTTFTISIMKSIDIRSESAIKLLAEFLDMDSSYVEGGRHVNAEHFAHEIYSFVRSPYRDIFVYDDVVQYDIPPDIAPPPRFNPRRRWRRRSSSRLRSRTGTPSGSHSRSRSRSPPESASLQIFPPIHSESDEPLCRSSPSRRVDDNSHGYTECTQPPLPTREMGSPRYPTITPLRLNPEERNGVETWEEKELPSVDHKDPLENQRPRGEQGKLPLFRTHVLVDSKGKQRAVDAQCGKNNDFDNVVQGKPSKQEIKMQREQSLPSFSAQPKVIERKPPRNRTLRECVEAHLSSGKRKSPGGNGDREDTDLDDIKDQAHIAGHDNVASTSSCHSLQQGADPVNEAVDGKESEDSHDSPNVSRREPRIISPRVIDTAMLAIETSTQDILPNQGGAISTDIDHVGKDRSSHAINNSADRDMTDIHLRSRLLSRLNEEKIYAYTKTTQCSTAEPQIAESAVNHHVDSQAAEDNLRKRARLRMKLAAEKRGIMNARSG
ncbi:hypothetical protein JOM56_005316 [Amanita muscaria]